MFIFFNLFMTQLYYFHGVFYPYLQSTLETRNMSQYIGVVILTGLKPVKPVIAICKYITYITKAEHCRDKESGFKWQLKQF